MKKVHYWWYCRAIRYTEGCFAGIPVTSVVFKPPNNVHVYSGEKELTDHTYPRVMYDIKKEYIVDMAEPCPIYEMESMFEGEEI